MRLVVDAMCAEFGGIRTYTENLLVHWHAVFPEDELHVVVPSGATLSTADHSRHELRVVGPSVAGRPLAQSTRMRRLVRQLSPDAVLATAPTTSVLALGAPLTVVVHDLRHELMPHQFSLGRRALRAVSYRRAYSIARGFIAVSQRTLDDLHSLHPRTGSKPSAVVAHGSDHVYRWPSASRAGPAIAFAHHTNKGPDLVLDAWAALAEEEGVGDLLLVGVPDERRARLEARIASCGLAERVRLAPFLPDEEFQGLLAGADIIVFPSDFEGFGLPVLEGLALGKPVVVGPDKAVLAVSGGHAFVMDEWTPGALAEATRAARGATEEQLRAGRAWARSFTWEQTVRGTREALEAGHLELTNRAQHDDDIK